MFSNNDLFNAWKEINRAAQRGERELFAQKLDQYIADFHASNDALRLLFYVGQHWDEAAYVEALSHFTYMRNESLTEKSVRCEAYLYALANSLPSEMIAKKSYLVSRFREAVGYPAK